MKVQVDINRCQSTAMCLAVAPELFTLTDDGVAKVLVDDVGPEFAALAKDAVQACPAWALSIVEDAQE